MKRSLLILFILTISYSKAQVIRWAADVESGAPYVFQDPESPSELIGFEADIMAAIANELDAETRFIQNRWGGLIPGLDRGDYDLAINGLEITDERKKEVYFSVPYYVTFEQIVVRRGYTRIQTLEDMKGKRVGTLRACLAEKIMNDAGGIQVHSYDSEVNSFEDLKNQRLDAVLIDAPVAVYYAGWNPDLELTGEPIGKVTYGIAIKKGNDELLDQINSALNSIIENGKLREILESWNLWNELIAEELNDHTQSVSTPDKYQNFISRQQTEMTFTDHIKRYISFAPHFAEAAWMTLKLTVVSMILAVILGLLIALMRIYAPEPFSSLAAAFIEVIRGTPLLIQLLFIFYALPALGINFPRFIAAVIALGLNYSAYEAENYRAGLYAISKGQMEAALSLGMNRKMALRSVIIPQAVRIVIPPITNDFISLLKDSSLVAIIALSELTRLYWQLAATYYDYIGTGLIIAAIYLLLGLPFVKLSKLAEKYFSYNSKK